MRINSRGVHRFRRARQSDPEYGHSQTRSLRRATLLRTALRAHPLRDGGAGQARGADAAVVSAAYQGASYGLLLIHVPDVLEALQQLAKQRVQKENAPVIGITGSVGKTTTKECAFHLLKKKVNENISNYNS